jgi:L-threonylcarbamoyladenylate synthase
VSATADEPEPLAYRRFDCTGDDSESYSAAIEAARQAVEAGDCVVLPTDTVYGIGVDAFSGNAVQRLLDAKGRGRDMPPPVLISEPSLIRALAVEVPQQARDLIERHWPGALTVICKIQPSLRMDLGDSEDTIALRVPDHELAREILRRTGPMAVSSANLSGQPAALTCDEAIDQLGDSVAVYLDGGELAATGGMPSTIVDFTRSSDGEVLRVGAISLDTLRETLPDLVDLTPAPPVESTDDGSDGAAPESPVTS